MAHLLDAEVISADSRQVYRGMDIGTGKDLSEYVVQGTPVRYHLIDIIEAGENYNLYAFQKDFQQALEEGLNRNKISILCGGTGLYIEAVLKGHLYSAVPIDPMFREELAAKSDEELLQIFQENPSTYTPLADTSTRKRIIRAIEIAFFLKTNRLSDIQRLMPQSHNYSNTPIFGIDLPVEMRRERISRRLRERLGNGMIKEVKNLLANGIPADKLIFYGLEYKFITQYLQGEFTYDEMVKRLEIAIHQFAKRQMTFFRKMERDGLTIHWLDGTKPLSGLLEEAMSVLSK